MFYLLIMGRCFRIIVLKINLPAMERKYYAEIMQYNKI